MYNTFGSLAHDLAGAVDLEDFIRITADFLARHGENGAAEILLDEARRVEDSETAAYRAGFDAGWNQAIEDGRKVGLDELVEIGY